ncbi:MAG: hypothetical protein HZC37_12240 [Burkholderiales bacterium]|nr:hypothetical protein [Burkholderiales bacterium]
MTSVVSPSFLARWVPFSRVACVALCVATGGSAALAQAVKAPPAGGPAPAPAVPQLAFELVTKAEARRDRELRPKNEALDMPEVRPRAMPGAAAAAAVPVFAIRVLAPTPQVAVTAPLRIELAFETPPGTRVVPSSFRVLYGVLKIDLTDRLRRFSTINERGVVVDQAVVPDGLHRLFLQVADDKGNLAEQELRLRVGVAS